jgi:4-carboxymuconolactone decarboxylase
MDEETLQRGVTVRRAVLGDEYVDRALATADDFNRGFQAFVSQYCWGECWGDETISRRERSILNLGMIAALGKMNEFELHVQGALRNGISEQELSALLKQIAVYCGIPVGVDCFRVARQALKANAATKLEEQK